MTEPLDREAVIDAGARAYADLNDGLSAHEDSAVDDALGRLDRLREAQLVAEFEAETREISAWLKATQ